MALSSIERLRAANPTMRLVFCGALFSLSQIALSQSTQDASRPGLSGANQQAIELAQKLGKERSAEGLEMIIGLRNVELLDGYRKGIVAGLDELSRNGGDTQRLLPAATEALVAKHYQDPQLGTTLRAIYINGSVRYQSRALFDAMYAEWRSGRVRPPAYDLRNAIVATDLVGIEASFVELLEKPAFAYSEDGNTAIRFLTQRNYRPATRTLISLARNAKPNAETSRLVHAALLKFGGAEASAASMGRLVWLRGQPETPEVITEIVYLMSAIAENTGALPWDYQQYRQALPTRLTTDMKSKLIRTIKRYKGTEGIPDLLQFLAERNLFGASLEVLTTSESPDVWIQVRTEIDRLNQQEIVSQTDYRHAKSTLDRMIANPGQVAKEKKTRERDKEFEAKLGALLTHGNSLRSLKDTAPEKYAAEYEAHLRAMQVLATDFADLPRTTGLRMNVESGYFALANFVRFRLGKPLKAIKLYESVADGETSGMLRLGSADTFLFDLRDEQGALNSLLPVTPKLQPQIGPAPVGKIEAAQLGWYRRWLGHQVDFLKTGKVFSGTIEGEQLGDCAGLLFFGGVIAMNEDVHDLAPIQMRLANTSQTLQDQPALKRTDVAQKLSNLPASNLTLLATFPLISALPDEDMILKYVNRHDPAGYLGACLFAIVRASDQAGRAGSDGMAVMLPGLAMAPLGNENPMRVAAERYLQSHNIVVRGAKKDTLSSR